MSERTNILGRTQTDILMDEARRLVRLNAMLEAWQRSERERMEREFQAAFKDGFRFRFYQDFGFYAVKPSVLISNYIA